MNSRLFIITSESADFGVPSGIKFFCLTTAQTRELFREGNGRARKEYPIVGNPASCNRGFVIGDRSHLGRPRLAYQPYNGCSADFSGGKPIRFRKRFKGTDRQGQI
jgi:hypothetical protein